MTQQTVVSVNNNPLIVTYDGRRILEVMRPDGSTFVPKNPRFIKRVRAQLPVDSPACRPGGCTPEELREFELTFDRVSLFNHDGTKRTTDEILAVSKVVNERNKDAQEQG